MAKILVVEDDPNVAQFLSTIAQQAGHTVAMATDALTAWTEFTESSDFKLVMIDQHLGGAGGNGLTLLSLLKSLPAPQQPAVIVCTGDARPETIRSYLSLGIADFIKKPFHGERVLAAIERVLGSKPATLVPVPARVVRGE